MDKLKMETPNITDKNIQKILELFPNVATEGVNKNGEVIRAIDFEKLKQELSGVVIDGKESYDFTWVGKKEAMVEANRPTRKTLRPDRESSVDWENTQNVYIEGDNLEVLKLLQESYLGKVKMIYIDPPYNTGKDFVYRDNFTQDKESYNEELGINDEEGNKLFQNTESNGRFHSDWCSMIYSRLKLARNLLSDDGVIFISIDDNEVENLHKICDEIFGENNIVAEIPWQSRASIQNDTDFSINHEYIIVYAKNRRQENRRLKESNYDLWHKHDSFVCKPLPLDKNKFFNPDNDIRGLWKADPFDAPNLRPNLTYIIKNPNTGIEYLPPTGRCWRTEESKFNELFNDGRIIFGKDGTSRPQLKVFYEEKKEYGSVDNSWFSADKVGTSTNGTKELMTIFNGKSYFDTPKPTSMLNKILTLANTNKDSIILDFFSGSATTAHAVMQLNAEDGGNRKFIMVQIPQPCDEKSEAYKAGYKTICEIGEERIRRAGKKIQEENPDKKIDTGFRVFKVDETNMKEIYYSPKEYSQNLLDSLESNIKEDRTDEDLLYGCLLDWGVELSLPHKVEIIDGKKIHIVNDNDLIACFEDRISEFAVREIAKKQPSRVVFRDSSFSSDDNKINVDEIFKLLAPNTTVKVV